ncbi:hypothetical protein ACFQ58_05975 [Agromyces sp. NPDC056523]|uniref:hypothetical protein n=1 Tax=Agromyces sp. NPDC056523 TaxID=3345850 RepID=UPI00366EDCF4
MSDVTTRTDAGIDEAARAAARDERWRSRTRIIGTVGLVAAVLLFAPIIAISTLGEPDFSGSADEVAAFFAAGEQAWAAAAMATASLGMVAFLWFAAGLTTILRRYEGEPAWRSTAALASAAVAAAFGVIDASWEAAANRGGTIDPAVAVYAFDVSNLGFANAWIALGAFAIGCGWVLVDGPCRRRAWAGWWAIAAGAGLIAVRYAWEGAWWFLPYAVFWAWVITMSIVLIVRRSLDHHAHG